MASLFEVKLTQRLLNPQVSYFSLLGSGSEWKKTSSGLNAEDGGAVTKSVSYTETGFAPKQQTGDQQRRPGGPPMFFNSKKEGGATPSASGAAT